MEYRGPYITDLMIVKGLRCPAGYVLLASTQSGDRASLTRKSFTKADVFLCVKKETDPKTVITDLTVVDMGRGVTPPGFLLIESRAGGMRSMVAVKRCAVEAAKSFIVDVCVTIQKKEKLSAQWHVVPTTLGDDVMIAYKMVRVNDGGEPRPPSRPPTQRLSSASLATVAPPPATASSLYPDADGAGPTLAPSGTGWAEPSQRSDVHDERAYRVLDGVAVELLIAPPAQHQQHTPSTLPHVPRAQIMQQYAYDTALENRILAAGT